MSDIQMMKDRITGMISQGEQLREKERLFLKVQGINEEIEKANQDRSATAKELKKAKEKKKGLIEKKNKAVAGAAEKITEKMNEVLPIGNAIFECSDGLTIGWKDGKEFTPYNGLSGGQKQVFDTALAHVLDANIIILEAAELDEDHILAALEDLSGLDKQVIINTCHPVKTVPESFVKIELDEVPA